MRLNSYFVISLFGAGLFTTTLVCFPPEIAKSQDTDYMRPKPGLPNIDTVHTAPVVNRIADKTDELRELTKGIGSNTEAGLKQTDKLDRSVDKLAGRLAKEPRTDSIITLTDTCTIFIPGESVYVRDSSLDGKTWWGKFFATNKRMLDQCKLHRLRVRVDFPKKHRQ